MAKPTRNHKKANHGKRPTAHYGRRKKAIHTPR